MSDLYPLEAWAVEIQSPHGWIPIEGGIYHRLEHAENQRIFYLYEGVEADELRITPVTVSSRQEATDG